MEPKATVSHLQTGGLIGQETANIYLAIFQNCYELVTPMYFTLFSIYRGTVVDILYLIHH